MAVDAAMLAFGRATDCALWRFYGWSEPSVTFGYSQKWDQVRQLLGSFEGACVRRLTGGGIVDHRNDLTYALSIPPPHPLYREAALDVYRAVHAGIAEIYTAAGIPATLAPCHGRCGGTGSTGPGVCFQSAEPYDVIHPQTGSKLAGAAMKRNRDGILIQGSLSRELPDFPGQEIIARQFGCFLAQWLGTGPSSESMPLPADGLAREEARFSSPEWNFKR
jgi:lipoate-protein ligase A